MNTRTLKLPALALGIVFASVLALGILSGCGGSDSSKSSSASTAASSGASSAVETSASSSSGESSSAASAAADAPASSDPLVFTDEKEKDCAVTLTLQPSDGKTWDIVAEDNHPADMVVRVNGKSPVKVNGNPGYRLASHETSTLTFDLEDIGVKTGDEVEISVHHGATGNPLTGTTTVTIPAA